MPLKGRLLRKVTDLGSVLSMYVSAFMYVGNDVTDVDKARASLAGGLEPGISLSIAGT